MADALFLLSCLSMGLLLGVKIRDIRMRHKYQKGFFEVIASPPDQTAWQSWWLIATTVCLGLLLTWTSP